MEADAEFKIQARFDKYDEFVTLQNEALSLDANPKTSGEESGRQINLVRDIINIVCRTWPPVFFKTYISGLARRISRPVVSAGPILRRIGDASSREIHILCSRSHHWQLPFRRYRDFQSRARAYGTIDSCVIPAIQLFQVQRP
jgi:hypothetical protein